MRAVYSFGVKKKYKHKLSILCFRFAVCLRVYVFRSCIRQMDKEYLFVCVSIDVEPVRTNKLYVSAPKRDVINCIKYDTFFLLCFCYYILFY